MYDLLLYLDEVTRGAVFRVGCGESYSAMLLDAREQHSIIL